MTISVPFLSAYDPAGNSEGTLDPLGLYQLADQLAVQLVPAVRERMQRIRFLTAIAVGAQVVEGLEDEPRFRDASPYLIWEWLVVEAMVRTRDEGLDMTAVPGSSVVKRALDAYGYVDARSYLKTPRIFGFFGVYKRLAVHLGLVNAQLVIGPVAPEVVQAWARGQGYTPVQLREQLAQWRNAVQRCLRGDPPRTQPNWGGDQWRTLALAFHPGGAKGWERNALRSLLVEQMAGKLGALPILWNLLQDANDDAPHEGRVLGQLAIRAPQYEPLVKAIKAYEAFSRSLQDGFDRLRAVAQTASTNGFQVTSLGVDAQFRNSVSGLDRKFQEAHRLLARCGPEGGRMQGLFTERFRDFGEPLSIEQIALRLCTHHQAVQKAKSALGKRAWFDSFSGDRIHVRQAYRIAPRDNAPGDLVHAYRCAPIHRFMRDLR